MEEAEFYRSFGVFRAGRWDNGWEAGPELPNVDCHERGPTVTMTDVGKHLL